jgi:hypothetical protein
MEIRSPDAPVGQLNARCIQKGWLSRTIEISGSLTATIHYNGWAPGESVYVNNVFTAKFKGVYISAVAPRIDFSINGPHGAVPAAVLASASYLRLLRLVNFKLIVAGRVVYQDGG